MGYGFFLNNNLNTTASVLLATYWGFFFFFPGEICPIKKKAENRYWTSL